MTINVIGEKGTLVELLVAAHGVALAVMRLHHVLAEQQKRLLHLVAHVASEAHVLCYLGINLQHGFLVVHIALALWRLLRAADFLAGLL